MYRYPSIGIKPGGPISVAVPAVSSTQAGDCPPPESPSDPAPWAHSKLGTLLLTA